MTTSILFILLQNWSH